MQRHKIALFTVNGRLFAHSDVFYMFEGESDNIMLEYILYELNLAIFDKVC